jgi:hypothetical protein
MKASFRNLSLFTTAFILFTINGTLSHELGHIAVAKLLGYETTLHFGSMNWESAQPYSTKDDFYILIGGPLQTIFTGILGLCILYVRKSRTKWRPIDWLAIFLSLFWLRPVFNLVISFFNHLYSNTNSYFGGDELRVSNHLTIWEGSTSLSTAIIGFLISYIVVFKIIPTSFRNNFLISGFIGGLGGFLFWFKILGPNFLP